MYVPGQVKCPFIRTARMGHDRFGAYPTGSDDGKVIKSSGYRVQVYAGNNTRQAKNEAYSVASNIKERFPDLPVYTRPCRFGRRAGDFRSIKRML